MGKSFTIPKANNRNDKNNDFTASNNRDPFSYFNLLNLYDILRVRAIQRQRIPSRSILLAR